MAVKYDQDSDPATHVVKGMPTLELHGHADPKAYGKVSLVVTRIQSC